MRKRQGQGPRKMHFCKGSPTCMVRLPEGQSLCRSHSRLYGDDSVEVRYHTLDCQMQWSSMECICHLPMAPEISLVRAMRAIAEMDSELARIAQGLHGLTKVGQDDVEDTRPWSHGQEATPEATGCDCIHSEEWLGESLHDPISGACLVVNPRLGPCPCRMTKPESEAALYRAWEYTKKMQKIERG